MKNLKWIIGEVEIIQIVEIVENEIFASFIPEATPENIRKIKWLYPNFADEKRKHKSISTKFSYQIKWKENSYRYLQW